MGRTVNETKQLHEMVDRLLPGELKIALVYVGNLLKYRPMQTVENSSPDGTGDSRDHNEL